MPRAGSSLHLCPVTSGGGEVGHYSGGGGGGLFLLTLPSSGPGVLGDPTGDGIDLLEPGGDDVVRVPRVGEHEVDMVGALRSKERSTVNKGKRTGERTMPESSMFEHESQLLEGILMQR